MADVAHYPIDKPSLLVIQGVRRVLVEGKERKRIEGWLDEDVNRFFSWRNTQTAR